MRVLAIMCISGLALIMALHAYFIEFDSPDRSLFQERDPRQVSVTFITGRDKTDMPFFDLATDHFALDTSERTDLVIHTCRTLEDIIEFMNESQLRGELPWSIVNIVAHGNPQTGLNLYITEEGHKATPKRLVQAILMNDLPPLDSSAIDSNTRINFWSCGIGTSPMMNASLRRIFRTTRGDTASVYCSPDFVVFHPSPHGAAPVRLSSSYWPYYYKRGYRPSDLEIRAALREQFPKADIDWLSAICNERPSPDDRPYHGEYHIPVSYVKVYASKSLRPDFRSDEDKIDWALSQAVVRDQIDETGIPAERFTWTVNKVIHTTADGEKVPAVKAIGMATVLYVIQPLSS